MQREEIKKKKNERGEKTQTDIKRIRAVEYREKRTGRRQKEKR